MKKISIIGTGRLGTSLGAALSQKGYSIKALSDRIRASAQESQKIIGAGKALTDNIQAAREGQILLLCVPDGEIRKVTIELQRAGMEWKKKTVFHCSGLLTSRLLIPLKAKGASVASLHPVQSISRKKTPLSQFQGIYFGIEGDPKALATAKQIIRALESRPLLIRAKDKPLYHAACTMASNLFVVLLDMARTLLQQAGFTENKALAALLPLVEGTLHNVKQFDIDASLTGPIVRGDRDSVKEHLQVLKRYPRFLKTYLQLGRHALQIANRKGLSPAKIRALRKLLEEK
ncbi:MAG: Rossmann-like and DUF2520 domain-containing protein [Candidatus Aminicenantales bacterium]